MPKRIQLSRKKGARKPADVVNVARPTKWGNPYKIKDMSDEFFDYLEPGEKMWVVVGPEGTELIETKDKREAAQLVVDEFREDILGTLRYDPEYLESLRGRDVCCWCTLDWPCHADVYLELAND